MTLGRAAALVAVSLFTVHLAACDGDLVVPRFEVRLGTIVFYGDGPELEYPAVVDAGVPFTVKVTTFGSGCYSKDGTVVTQVGDLERFVEPRDSVRVEVACPDILLSFVHSAEVVFPEAGEATLVFVGREAPADSVVRLRRTVTVR